MLQRRRVNDIVDIRHRHFETRLVAHIADEVAKARIFLVADLEIHLVLLELVARKNDDTARLVARQHGLHEALAERARSTRDSGSHAKSCQLSNLLRYWTRKDGPKSRRLSKRTWIIQK